MPGFLLACSACKHMSFMPVLEPGLKVLRGWHHWQRPPRRLHKIRQAQSGCHLQARAAMAGPHTTLTIALPPLPPLVLLLLLGRQIMTGHSLTLLGEEGIIRVVHLWVRACQC